MIVLRPYQILYFTDCLSSQSDPAGQKLVENDLHGINHFKSHDKMLY